MMTWNEYHDRLRKGRAEIGAASQDIVRSYCTPGEAGKKNDRLGAEIRELIAPAVAITVRYNGCIVAYAQREAALQNGATEEQILEALGVGITVNVSFNII